MFLQTKKKKSWKDRLFGKKGNKEKQQGDNEVVVNEQEENADAGKPESQQSSTARTDTDYIPVEEPAAQETPIDPFQGLKVSQLKQLARDSGTDISTCFEKSEIIDALKKNRVEARTVGKRLIVDPADGQGAIIAFVEG